MSETPNTSSLEALKSTLKTLEKERLNLLGQLEDITQDSSEHRLVLKNLDKLPEDRRCYRIIGGVAVEGTVKLVKPALSSYADRLDELKGKLTSQLELLNKEITKVTTSLQNPNDNL